MQIMHVLICTHSRYAFGAFTGHDKVCLVRLYLPVTVKIGKLNHMFADLEQREQRYSADQSAQVIKAYYTILEPLSRAQYLVSLFPRFCTPSIPISFWQERIYSLFLPLSLADSVASSILIPMYSRRRAACHCHGWWRWWDDTLWTTVSQGYNAPWLVTLIYIYLSE